MVRNQPKKAKIDLKPSVQKPNSVMMKMAKIMTFMRDHENAWPFFRKFLEILKYKFDISELDNLIQFFDHFQEKF